jgi:hypothetical protein
LKSQWRGALRFEQLASVYKASRINLNSHVRPDGLLYINERFTNVLGCGAFMLVDNVAGLSEMREAGEAFDIYDSLEDPGGEGAVLSAERVGACGGRGTRGSAAVQRRDQRRALYRGAAGDTRTAAQRQRRHFVAVM